MNIEGIPDGWELVRIGRVKRGEFRLSNFGQPIHWEDSQESGSVNYVIIRKIKKPKRYRPFANAAEAEAFWDAKLQFKGLGVDRFRVTAIRATGVTIGGSTYKYAEAFERLECSDGTPFGVEVVDD